MSSGACACVRTLRARRGSMASAIASRPSEKMSIIPIFLLYPADVLHLADGFSSKEMRRVRRRSGSAQSRRSERAFEAGEWLGARRRCEMVDKTIQVQQFRRDYGVREQGNSCCRT